MSSPTDQQLIQYIGQGRRDALAQLFDRYSADLYDYLARLVGDRDQAARLLDQVMLRVPGAAAGFQPRDSVRGWLYSLAREAGLDWLRQRGWLDGLPPSDEPIPPGLQGDVWKAARAMPGFFRAVLITEELQPLSPTEKARALGVNRTDLARLIEEARRSFNRIYDAQARAEGRPTSDRINTDVVWNARRRLPVEGGSLFGFLPLIEFPDSLKQNIRRHVVEAMSPPPARPMGGIAGDAGAAAAGVASGSAINPMPPPQVPPVQAPPPALPPTVTAVLPEPPPPERRLAPIPPYQPDPDQNRGINVTGLPTTALAALLGIALALLICGGVFFLLQNRSGLTITATQPPNGATVQQTPEMNVIAVYSGDSEVDRDRTTMQIDGRPVTPLFVNNSVAWTGPLDVGSHVVAVLIVDRADKRSEQSWTFFVVAAPGTPTVSITPGGVASVTPILPVETVTPIAPVTSQVVTVTPIVVPISPTPIFPFTPPPPPTFVPFTPCNQGGVSGVAFNDLNGNGVRDGEPGLAGVTISLKTQLNSVFAVTVTDGLGNYRFTNVPFGSYRVQANTPTGWFPTTNTDIPVFIGGCGIIPGFNFGFMQTPPPITWTPTLTWTPIVITATPSYTPSPTITNVPPPVAVTNVTAFVTPTSSTSCPQTFTFNGGITTNGATTVNYQWVRSDGSLSPVQVLSFPGAGTQNVASDSWTLGSPGFNFNGWERIQVLSPNSITSVLASFTLNCPPITDTPTVTPSPTTVVTNTPTPTPTLTTAPFMVISANANVSPNNSVTCPENFTFNGDITVTGTGTVTYQWEGTDSLGNTITGPASSLGFPVPGTQPLTSPFIYTYNGPGPLNVTGGLRLHILSPNVFDSGDANYTLNCPF